MNALEAKFKIQTGRLEPGTKIAGNLILHDLPVEFLPANLNVVGDLEITRCNNLAELGTGLLTRNLVIRECRNLTRLPAGLHVTQTLDLSSNRVEIEISGGSSVGGNLVLAESSAALLLPEDFHLAGDFHAELCPWLKTPPQFKNYRGNLHMDASGLEAIPDGFKTEGSLFASGCAFLKSVGQGVRVEGNLALERCERLRTIGDDLYVGVDLALAGCTALKSIGRGLCCEMLVDLQDCASLESLPDGFYAGQGVDIAGTGLKNMPARWEDSDRLRWRRVPVRFRDVFRPEQISVEEIVSESNAQYRRVLLELFGVERFFAQARAEVLDQDEDRGGRRRLLRVVWDDSVQLAQSRRGQRFNSEGFDPADDEPVVCLEVRCPSTKAVYILRVPPKTKTCARAAAWVAGFDDVKRYDPIVET